MANDYTADAALLKTAMRKAGINQKQLARLVIPTTGETEPAAYEKKVEQLRQDINKVANAGRGMGPRLAKQLAPHLGVSPEDLIVPKTPRARAQETGEQLAEVLALLREIADILRPPGLSTDNAEAVGAREEIAWVVAELRRNRIEEQGLLSKVMELIAAPDAAAWREPPQVVPTR